MNDPISILGLKEDNLEATIYDLLRSSHGIDATLFLTGDSARRFLDILQKIIDESHERPLLFLCRKMLQKLSEKSGELPNSLFVDNIQRHGNNAVSGGGCADIWKGTHNDQIVALKVLRIFTTTSALRKLHKEFCREALVWRQLKHHNITPFIGVSIELFKPHMCMVSPWMPNGNILQYLERNLNRDRVELLYGVAEGINYLHSMEPPFVHGDIRGANILISEGLHPMLSDFGLAVVSDTQTATYGTGSMVKGSIRWMAPELFKPGLFEGTPGGMDTIN